VKKRITVNLDEDLVEALKELDAPSVSAAVNSAVRDAVEREAHRRALSEWLHELYDRHGPPSEADYAAAQAVLDEAMGRTSRADDRRGAA
jgi:Arc/MetJ-type ribon-helix-helix transcriptional regulator